MWLADNYPVVNGRPRVCNSLIFIHQYSPWAVRSVCSEQDRQFSDNESHQRHNLRSFRTIEPDHRLEVRCNNKPPKSRGGSFSSSSQSVKHRLLAHFLVSHRQRGRARSNMGHQPRTKPRSLCGHRISLRFVIPTAATLIPKAVTVAQCCMLGHTRLRDHH